MIGPKGPNSSIGPGPVSPEEALGRAGLRLTHQRLEIFRELSRAQDHPSAEEIFHRVRERVPTISLDTVYRTLTTLEEHRLIARLDVGAGQARFDSNLEPHHHLVCSKCQRVVDFKWTAFEGADLPELAREWGRVVRKQVVLRGVCRSCLKNLDN